VQSHILHGYATYVLHLERALEEVDAALSLASATKKPKKQTTDDWLRICQILQRLEENSAEKGETGLAISLSKPFQRLLKYPLLFQNLLYHTDPSTFEYESTLQMVAEVETIVRSIEDEKIQKEERDRTRDAFARIDGIDKVRELAAPKASRLLVEERPLLALGAGTASAKGKTSFKRLSDVLSGTGSGGVGGKKDLWLVAFNDVVLRCQRTGTTSLPIVAATNTRTTSLPDLQGKSKYATTGRRQQTKPRNLYKYLKVRCCNRHHGSNADSETDRDMGYRRRHPTTTGRRVHGGVSAFWIPGGHSNLLSQRGSCAWNRERRNRSPPAHRAHAGRRRARRRDGL
jgi:hypothetical protein